MGVVTTKSTRVSNADAAPRIMDMPNVNHGKIRRVTGTLEAVSGDSIASIYRLVRVHSSWSIVSIRLYCDAITTCAGDIGLYRVSGEASGVVVAVAAYASAQSLATAITEGTNVAFEARDVIKAGNAVYQDAGLTTDPNLWYDLAITLTAAAGSAGSIVLDVAYVGNE